MKITKELYAKSKQRLPKLKEAETIVKAWDRKMEECKDRMAGMEIVAMDVDENGIGTVTAQPLLDDGEEPKKGEGNAPARAGAA